jgi:hypothetical protein
VSEITYNSNVKKGLRILYESIDIDAIPGLNLTDEGRTVIMEALEWIDSKAYQGELTGLYAEGTNYDPYGAW